MDEEQSFVKNAADPEQVKEAERKEKSAEEKELDDLFWVLSTVQGRRYFWRLLSFCGIFESSFSGGEALPMAYLEGQRNVGLVQLKNLMEIRPEAFIQMIQENKNLRKGK